MESTDLYQKLNDLRQEAYSYKKNPQLKSVWGPEEDNLIDELTEMINLLHDTTEDLVQDIYKDCILSRYSSFRDYLNSKSLDVARYNNSTLKKIKTKRQTSKITACKICGAPTEIQGNEIKCTVCENVTQIVSKNTKSTANNLKHSRDKINCLLGKMQPPKKFQDLEKYISIWLTDLEYLYEWLDFQEKSFKLSKTVLSKSNWIRKFQFIYKPKDESKTWKMKIEKSEKYKWTFLEFKELISEFYSMLSECSRLAKKDYITSNMLSIDEEKIYEIMKNYHESNNKLPNIQEIFSYENENYDIGNYINYLKLTNCDSELKLKLDELFGEKIKVPGLMFNFLTICGERIINRFTLIEGYSYIIHKTFEIPFMDIPNEEIEEIMYLIQQFDIFVETKRSQGNQNGKIKKNNSKLYTCKLQQILKLPRFFKYIGLVEYLPVKSSDTSAAIGALWDEFRSANKEIMVKYFIDPDDNEEEKINPISSRKIFDGII